MGVFLNGAVHHLIDRTVMTEVDDLASRALQDALHDVDGGIVAVEEGGGDGGRMAERVAAASCVFFGWGDSMRVSMEHPKVNPHPVPVDSRRAGCPSDYHRAGRRGRA